MFIWFTYMMTILSALFNPLIMFTWWCLVVHMMLSGLVSHDGVWSRVEPVCDVWHLSHSAQQVVQAGAGHHQLSVILLLWVDEAKYGKVGPGQSVPHHKLTAPLNQ